MYSRTTLKHEDEDGSVIIMEIPGDKDIYAFVEEIERFLIAMGYGEETVKKGWEYLSPEEEE